MYMFAYVKILDARLKMLENLSYFMSILKYYDQIFWLYNF